MKRMMIGVLLMACASAFASTATEEQLKSDERPLAIGFSPLMLGFFTPLQVPGSDYDMGGLRLNLFYGTCCNFDGLDIGFVGVSKNRANGWLINLVSVAYGDGLGLHTGGVNYFSGDFKGLQIGLANWIDSGDAFQIGLYNGAYDVQGLQIGVINMANKMLGFQIGVVNIISTSELSFLPIINGWF